MAEGLCRALDAAKPCGSEHPAVRLLHPLPHFDPAEAGTSARALLLLEAPVPNTVPEWGGSGFISVDNNDPTAQNVWQTRNEVGLHEHTLAWNIVPWVLGRASVKPSKVELAQGSLELPA